MRRPGNNRLKAVALFCICAGLFTVIRSMGLIQGGTIDTGTPNVVVALSGIAFIIAGFMLVKKHQSPSYDLLAAILCLVFGLVSAWGAVFFSAEDLVGGLPFINHEINAIIARLLYGLGSLLLFKMAWSAFKRFSDAAA